MSGFYWEKHYSKILLEFRFQRILGSECRCLHPTGQAIFSVYVDDFKLAGKQASLALAWQLMRDEGLRLDTLERFKQYLGCGQRTRYIIPQEVQRRREHVHLARVDLNKLEAGADVEKSSAGFLIRAIA